MNRIPRLRHLTPLLLMLAVAAVVALAAACGDDGGGDELITVRATQAIEAPSFLPVYAARFQDFYEEEGIDLDFTPGATGGQESQALLAGDADIVFSSGSELLKLAAQDRDVVGVCGIEIGGVDVLVMESDLAAENGITSDSPLEDFLVPEIWDGARVGFTSPGALSNGLVLYWATQAGVSVDDVEQIALGGGATQVAGIAQDEVDFISSFHPFADQMASEGDAVIVIDMTQEEDPSLAGWMEQIIVTTTGYAEENPEAVSRACAATARGAQWVNDNSVDDVVDMWASFEAFSQLDREILATQVEQYQDGGIFPNDGAMPLQGLEVVQTVAVGAGIIEAPIENLEDLLDTSFLP